MRGQKYITAYFIIWVFSLLSLGTVSAVEDNERLQHELDLALSKLYPSEANDYGVAIAMMTENKKLMTVATGVADPANTAMSSKTPVRIASITKTFVAVAILRLYEQGKLDLDAPIQGLISSTLNQKLISGGYDTSTITTRHLLSHTAGLNDHTKSERFFDIVFKQKDFVWTREKQIEVLVEDLKPVAKVGEKFSYSDSGYILLGDIIERLTEQPLSKAIYELNSFNQLGIKEMYWDGQQDKDHHRAHQWIGTMDAYDISPTVDAFGGGGLVSSMEELAVYFDALFSGRIFNNKDTLTLMTSPPNMPADSPYRYGLFEREVHGCQIYSHSGYWGTLTAAVPKLNVVISGVVLNQSGYKTLSKVTFELIDKLIEEHASNCQPNH